MKQKWVHRMGALALCGALLGGTAALAAGVTYKTIQVLYNDISLVVDGVPITPRDANGVEVEPFVYNGTTYLPVRAVGEAIGKQVTWDGNTQTVYIGEAPGQATYLIDVCPAYESSSYNEIHSSEGEQFRMSGTSYSNGFTLAGDNGYALFNLNGLYDSLKFTIGHIDGTYMEDRIITFVVDGKTVDTIHVGAENLPEEYTVPLDYGLQLKILVADDETNASWVYNAAIGFANAKLIR